jgi:curved DNA-binding protein CbpA
MRPEFQKAIDNALLHCRGAKQRAIYGVFDQFDWNLEDAEVEYAAKQAGFKSGWVYHHMGPRRAQSRETYQTQSAYEEQLRARQAEQRAQRAQQASSAQQAQYAQEEAMRNANRAQRMAEEALRSQFEWLFRAGMREAMMPQQASDGCPGYIEPMVRRFGLKWPFTAAELKKVYRKKCMETHPDKGGTAEAFNQVQKDNAELERYAQGAA